MSNKKDDEKSKPVIKPGDAKTSGPLAALPRDLRQYVGSFVGRGGIKRLRQVSRFFWHDQPLKMAYANIQPRLSQFQFYHTLKYHNGRFAHIDNGRLYINTMDAKLSEPEIFTPCDQLAVRGVESDGEVLYVVAEDGIYLIDDDNFRGVAEKYLALSGDEIDQFGVNRAGLFLLSGGNAKLHLDADKIGSADGLDGLRDDIKTAHKKMNVSKMIVNDDNVIYLTEEGKIEIFQGINQDSSRHNSLKKVGQDTPDVTQLNIVDITACDAYALLTSRDGKVFALGENRFLVEGEEAFLDEPKLLTDLQGLDINKMICAYDQLFVLTKDDAVFCKGNNFSGQLGLGKDVKEQSSLVEQPFFKGKEVNSVSLFENNTVFICEQGLYGCGLNANNVLCQSLYERVGYETSTVIREPKLIACSLKTWPAVSKVTAALSHIYSDDADQEKVIDDLLEKVRLAETEEEIQLIVTTAVSEEKIPVDLCDKLTVVYPEALDSSMSQKK